MNAYKCDVCGKMFELPDYDSYRLEEEGIYCRIPMEIWNYKSRGVGIKYDICSECRDKILKFMEEIQPNE